MPSVFPVPWLAALAMVALVATLAEAVRRRNVPASANAAGAVVLAIAPTALELATAADGLPTLDPLLTLWLAVAGFLHTLGMLGYYESRWWWDHLTHAVSAALVAALVYAALLATGSDLGLSVGPATVLITVAVGVVWELLELVARDVAVYLDLDPVLVHYGWRDTAFDLVFDAVGAVLVVFLDVRVFLSLTEEFPRATRAVLGWTGVVGVGSVVTVGGFALARWLHRPE